MLALKKILVPRDFSDCGEAAVHYALDLARRTEAEVHLLFVEVLYSDAYAPTSIRTAPEETLREQLLAGVQDGLPGEAGEWMAVVPAVRYDVAAAPAIVAHAEEHAIDVIVMGTHGRRGLRRLLLGSAAEEVVRTAPCPVVVARCTEAEAWAGPHGPNTILVPVDFSRHARVALRHAKELAGLFNARLALLHIVEELVRPTFYNTGALSIYDMMATLEGRAREELETFFKETEGPAVEATFHTRHGNAAHEILGFAGEHEPTLIVMATHGLKGVQHFLMGSVAEKVVRLAACPVFTVKAFGKMLVPLPALTEEEVAEH